MTNLKANIYHYCSERPIAIDKITKELARASLIADEDDFPFVVELAKQDDLFDELLSSLAMASLPAWGVKGVDQLLDFAFEDIYKNITSTLALDVLLTIARHVDVCSKSIRFLPKAWDSQQKYHIDEEISNYALYGLRERLLLAFDDEKGRSKILFTISLMAQFYGTKFGIIKEALDFFLSLIVDNHLLLNPTILKRFESLIKSNPVHEERLQTFLTEHPILLNPFVSTLYTKQELGSDFITDYVIKQTNNQYVIVEIESSTDKLFNQNGSFSSHLTAALAQVRDFQAWISDNLSYAQKKLPSIKHPEGLVVIGRRPSLNEMQIKRLAEENYSRRGYIKIITYDDLLDTAKNVYKNIIERPLVLKTKDTKSI